MQWVPNFPSIRRATDRFLFLFSCVCLYTLSFLINGIMAPPKKRKSECSPFSTYRQDCIFISSKTCLETSRWRHRCSQVTAGFPKTASYHGCRCSPPTSKLPSRFCVSELHCPITMKRRHWPMESLQPTLRQATSLPKKNDMAPMQYFPFKKSLL